MKFFNSCILPILPVLPRDHTYKAFFKKKRGPPRSHFISATKHFFQKTRTLESPLVICNVWSAGKTGRKSAEGILSKWPFSPIFFQIFKIVFLAEMGCLTHPSCPEKRIFPKYYQKYKKCSIIAEKKIYLNKAR